MSNEEHKKVGAPDEEKLVWEGSPKWQADFGYILLSSLIILTGLTLLIMVFRFWFVGLALMVTGAVMIVAIRLKRRHQRYKITNMILEFEEGVFSTHIENMELWRINDIGYHQNIFDKILGVSKIRMATQDKSHPVFEIVGLPPGRQVYDQMKEGVHIARQARNVLGMTE